MLQQAHTTTHKQPVATAGLNIGDNVRARLESSTMEGFIRHPRNFPMEVRRIWFERKTVDRGTYDSDLGLCFTSDKHVPTGAILEVRIPLRGEEQKFRGKVVLVRNRGEYYEIGIWLERKADAHRARMVEQICHIETYLKDKHRKEGPFVSKERVAEEWISKFASTFPGV